MKTHPFLLATCLLLAGCSTEGTDEDALAAPQTSLTGTESSPGPPPSGQTPPPSAAGNESDSGSAANTTDGPEGPSFLDLHPGWLDCTFFHSAIRVDREYVEPYVPPGYSISELVPGLAILYLSTFHCEAFVVDNRTVAINESLVFLGADVAYSSENWDAPPGVNQIYVLESWSEADGPLSGYAHFGMPITNASLVAFAEAGLGQEVRIKFNGTESLLAAEPLSNPHDGGQMFALGFRFNWMTNDTYRFIDVDPQVESHTNLLTSQGHWVYDSPTIAKYTGQGDGNDEPSVFQVFIGDFPTAHGELPPP